MTPSYRNLNAINAIEYYLCNTQALARRAGEINGETEHSLARRYHVIKTIIYPTYLDDRKTIFAIRAHYTYRQESCSTSTVAKMFEKKTLSTRI